ncbi:cardiolipin synthase (CMP-forming), mitochondrial [Olea europaea subsp. europaea]|uniref:Cardiolipin synthase (CMP-forming), mitochondrial n=1 Tax=Olea europaea subsp. europaea TaxID=158383 RepID=A0A8S0SLM4_OLEEU|nr:cardiolipin synthase (CMP-forming), mitochondrial [Olea europaea subsp. europaea]
MAFFRSLKTLVSKSIKNQSNSTSPSRTFLSLVSPTPTPNIFSLSNNHRHFLFRSKFFSPFSNFGGPLFLSNPPWKLSQSATPLLLQSDVVLNFLKLRVRALDLLHRPPFRYNLGFQSNASVQRLLSHERDKKKLIHGSELDISSGGVTDSYLNLPNYISVSRLLSGPLLGWMITQEMYLPAFVGLAISGATDWLDGYLARRMKINSVVGSYLDPLADKVLIGCVALAMVDMGLLHPGLVALVVLRDVALVGGAVYKRASSLDWEWESLSHFFNLDSAGAQKVEPLFISKVNTVFQLLLVAAALLQPSFGNEETLPYITYLSWLVALTTTTSTVAYGAQHLRNNRSIWVEKPSYRT